MRRTTIPAILTIAAALTACSTTDTTPPDNAPATTQATPAPLTAETAADHLANHIPTMRITTTFTAETDPKKLLGRPHQYTSKVAFDDTRITDPTGSSPDDVTRGGIIEVFATRDDAQRRSDYIQTFVKHLPFLAEYNYIHGRVLVRVTMDLTPSQAAEYDKAARELAP